MQHEQLSLTTASGTSLKPAKSAGDSDDCCKFVRVCILIQRMRTSPRSHALQLLGYRCELSGPMWPTGGNLFVLVVGLLVVALYMAKIMADNWSSYSFS